VADEALSAPTSSPTLASKARDLEALKNAVVDAAGVGAGLWFSYLFLLLYLFISVGGVGHRDLLLENPVKLPFLGIELPLGGFFVIGPLLLIIVHTYVLLHFVLLAGKVGSFHNELLVQIDEEDIRTRLRRQLPSNIFVQFLAGPREIRTGVLGWLLRLIAQISLVLAPVALLVYFQLQFLPYHDWKITWWHRIAVVADLSLLWTLWPSIARGNTTRIRMGELRGGVLVLYRLIQSLRLLPGGTKATRTKWRVFCRVAPRGKIATVALASLVPVVLVFTVATFPGEWLDDLPSFRFIRVTDDNGPRMASLHEVLVVGSVDPVTRTPVGFWSNRLVVPGIDVIDRSKFDTDEKLAASSVVASFRGRHLDRAVLTQATLTKADFTGADLRGALLDGARLQGALLEGAQLDGASLDDAQLQGAILRDASLRGASLVRASLQGASLVRASPQGAHLNFAQLQGASLDAAQLQSAFLAGAQLQGASLDGANLQFASLARTNLQSASLGFAFLWMADARDATGSDVRLAAFSIGPCVSTDQNACTFEEVKRDIEQRMPTDTRNKYLIMQSIEQEFSSKRSIAKEILATWVSLRGESPKSGVYEDRLAKQLLTTACSNDGGS
jgi:uncharacterized protein YjbI with pentapeptide repeats